MIPALAEYMSPRWTLVIGTTACLYLSVHTLIVPKQNVEGECGEEDEKCIPSTITPEGLDSYALVNCDVRLVRKHRPVIEEYKLAPPTNPVNLKDFLLKKGKV
jgi:hypothetical protein